MNYEPLRALTGEESEWMEIDGDGLCQNRRCSHVFRRADGTAYDINGRIFREPSGACYSSSESSVDVTFPYVPKTVYVDVDDDGNPINRDEAPEEHHVRTQPL